MFAPTLRRDTANVKRIKRIIKGFPRFFSETGCKTYFRGDTVTGDSENCFSYLSERKGEKY